MLPTIIQECSQFLIESNGQYIVKSLPKTYQGFMKVKARRGKKETEFSKSFNKAFEHEEHDLHQRAIFGYTDITLLLENIEYEPFYIFPIDGYEFIYNPVVCNSTNDYGKIDADENLISDLLKTSYQTGPLSEAIQSKCEIVFYGIAYYYALRATLIEDYKTFFETR